MAGPVFDSSRKRAGLACWTLRRGTRGSNDRTFEHDKPKLAGRKRTNIDPFRPPTVKLSLTDNTSPPTQSQARNKGNRIGLVSPFMPAAPVVWPEFERA
jgi:hypothetical protein